MISAILHISTVVDGVLVAFFGALSVGIGIRLLRLFKNVTKGLDRLNEIGTEVSAINTAVNHVPSGSPTLIHRVGIMEEKSKDHRVWEKTVLEAICKQLGIKLPPHPEEGNL